MAPTMAVALALSLAIVCLLSVLLAVATTALMPWQEHETATVALNAMWDPLIRNTGLWRLRRQRQV